MNIIRIGTGLVLIVGAGIVHGAWTGRWGPSPALLELAQQVESVPMDIGDWQGTARELPAEERAMAGAVACLNRRYWNPSRGVSVSVLLVGGLPGKISTHTPDVCYPGAGYTLDSPVAVDFHYGPDRRQAGYRTALATRGGANPSVLRIFWGWNAADGWSAPERARWEFRDARTLCKLYVIRDTAGIAADPQHDPCNDFLNVFLPELDKVVFLARK